MTQLKHDSLWAITRGQRFRYFGAVFAMGVANVFMFGAPLVAKYAIDVVVGQDVALGAPWLLVPGTWLGLPTVYSIIREASGRIEVDTELGKGTTFSIFLPATP